MQDPGFAAATISYTRWLGAYMTLDYDGLRKKAEKMKAGRFAFLRATFYRWRWQFMAVDQAVRDAQVVLSAADTHLENFATWRDAEGRLAWGISDFDEVARLPFTSDLVRMAASIALEREDSKDRLELRRSEAIAEFLAGYRGGLGAGGSPFVLERHHPELRAAAEASYDPVKEWAEIESRGVKGTPPDEVQHLLVASLPETAEPVCFRMVNDKGLGSLGRPRWVLVAEWRGGLLAREAKGAAPSAWHMDEPGRHDPVADQRLGILLSLRAPDPILRVVSRREGAWVIRRLSPEARKIELDAIARLAVKGGKRGKTGGQASLLRAMGAEIANLHVGGGADPVALRRDLDTLAKRDPDWLPRAAEAAAARVETDRADFLDAPGVVAPSRP